MKFYEKKLRELVEKSSLRGIKCVSENTLNLSSNDYLGIASDTEIRRNFLKQYDKELSNPSARLLSNNENFDKLERYLENKMDVEKVLLFNSGYHANIGIYSSLVTSEDIVFCDKLNHASIIDGIKLGKAKLMPFGHLDYTDLAIKLENHRKKYRRAVISSETLFSMDGDYANLHKLIELKKEFDCLLFIDEAHTFGVYGNGMGYAYELGIVNDIDLIMGTFGKAIGSYGAFCAGSETIINYLINFARPFIFSTTFPPISAAFSEYILGQTEILAERSKKLLQLSKNVRKEAGLTGEGYVVPFILGGNRLAVKASNNLIKSGYYALPIRYPTVAKNSARVRLSLNSNMNFEELKPCLNILKSFSQTNTDVLLTL